MSIHICPAQPCFYSNGCRRSIQDRQPGSPGICLTILFLFIPEKAAFTSSCTLLIILSYIHTFIL